MIWLDDLSWQRLATQIGEPWARGASVGEALRARTAFGVSWTCDMLRLADDTGAGTAGAWF